MRIADVTRPATGEQGPGGIRELRIPGVTAREALRPPVLAERALAGRDLETTGLTYLFERTTGDDPFRRDPRRGTAGATLVRDRLDGERGLERVFSPPAARRWRADGWGTVAVSALDSAIDDLAGVTGGRFESSGRFQGRPGFRASGAFDGRTAPLDRLVDRRRRAPRRAERQPRRVAPVDGPAHDHRPPAAAGAAERGRPPPDARAAALGLRARRPPGSATPRRRCASGATGW